MNNANIPETVKANGNIPKNTTDSNNDFKNNFISFIIFASFFFPVILTITLLNSQCFFYCIHTMVFPSIVKCYTQISLNFLCSILRRQPMCCTKFSSSNGSTQPFRFNIVVLYFYGIIRAGIYTILFKCEISCIKSNSRVQMCIRDRADSRGQELYPIQRKVPPRKP